MITYIPYIPIALPQTHYGGGTVIPLYVFVELGLIDSGYTGEVKAIVKTLGIGAFTSGDIFIPAGTKIAQMRIVEIPNTELVSGVIKIQENDDKKRGDNGFNSTGVK